MNLQYAGDKIRTYPRNLDDIHNLSNVTLVSPAIARIARPDLPSEWSGKPPKAEVHEAEADRQIPTQCRLVAPPDDFHQRDTLGHNEDR